MVYYWFLVAIYVFAIEFFFHLVPNLFCSCDDFVLKFVIIIIVKKLKVEQIITNKINLYLYINKKYTHTHIYIYIYIYMHRKYYKHCIG